MVGGESDAPPRVSEAPAASGGRRVRVLPAEIAAPGTPARQSRDEILRDLPERLAALHAIAGDVYARWAQTLAR